MKVSISEFLDKNDAEIAWRRDVLYPALERWHAANKGHRSDCDCTCEACSEWRDAHTALRNAWEAKP